METVDLEPSAREDISSDDDSSDDSDVESPAGARDPKEREIERLRVLEAAGLLVRDETPNAAKRRPTRRAAPARPPRQALRRLPSTAESSEDARGGQVLEEPPVEPEEQEERMEDAFDVSLPLSAFRCH